MPFVVTKFGLPTVTRTDGTLGAYAPFNSNPRGDRFIWPAERIAILLAKQKAAEAAKKKSWWGLGDDSPVNPVSLVPSGPAVSPDMVKAGQYDLETIQQLLGTQAALVAKAQMAAAKKPGQATPQTQAGGQTVLSSIPSWAWWTGGITLAAAVVLGMSKRSGQRTGRPIVGAHVYESL